MKPNIYRQVALAKIAKKRFEAQVGGRVVLRSWLSQDFFAKSEARLDLYADLSPEVCPVSKEEVPSAASFPLGVALTIVGVKVVTRKYSYLDESEDYIDGVQAKVEAETKLILLREIPERWFLIDFFHPWSR